MGSFSAIAVVVTMMLPYLFPFVIYVTVIPYLLAMILITFVFKVKSHIVYIIMGIFCVAPLLLVRQDAVHYMDSLITAIPIVIVSVVCGFFYSVFIKKINPSTVG